MSIIRGKRAVAYFDILGFKDKVEKMPIESLSDTYEALIARTLGELAFENGEAYWKNVCFRYIFSDSIFLIAQEDSEDSFIDLISYAWRMMQSAITLNLPLRGSVAYGELYANTDRNVFLGTAITEAVITEGMQNWIGAIVNDSAITRYKGIFEKKDIQYSIMNYILPQYEVPLKDGKNHLHYVINWRENMVSQSGIKCLFHNDFDNAMAQEKIDNTLKFSKAVVDSRKAYFDDEQVPIRYRRFYIGDGPPPKSGPMFTNGDEY